MSNMPPPSGTQGSAGNTPAPSTTVQTVTGPLPAQPTTSKRSAITGFFSRAVSAVASKALTPIQRVGELVDQSGQPINVTIPGPQAPETADQRVERYRRTVEKLDDDKESWLDFLVRWFLTINAYLWPIWIAYAIGNEIGAAYGGRWDWGDPYSVGMHSGSLAVEFVLAGLSFATAHALAKAFIDNSYISKAVLAALFFLLLSTISGVSQWYILTQHIQMTMTTVIAGHAVTTTDGAAVTQGLFRTLIGPAVDVGSLIFLSIMKIKSLKKELAKLELKAAAIQQLNMKEIEVERASTDAQQTRERNSLIMEMERMNLEDVRNKMQGQMNGNNGNQARW